MGNRGKSKIILVSNLLRKCNCSLAKEIIPRTILISTCTFCSREFVLWKRGTGPQVVPRGKQFRSLHWGTGCVTPSPSSNAPNNRKSLDLATTRKATRIPPAPVLKGQSECPTLTPKSRTVLDKTPPLRQGYHQTFKATLSVSLKVPLHVPLRVPLHVTLKVPLKVTLIAVLTVYPRPFLQPLRLPCPCWSVPHPPSGHVKGLLKGSGESLPEPSTHRFEMVRGLVTGVLSNLRM